MVKIQAKYIEKTLEDLTQYLGATQAQFASPDGIPFFASDGAINADSLLTLQMASFTAQLYGLAEDDARAMLDSPSLSSWAHIIELSLSTRSDPSLVFSTSGTTGTPKTITHKLSVLRQEVAHWHSCFADVEVIYSLVPAHHIYGFIWTVLLPQQLGITVKDCRQQLPAFFIDPALRGLIVGIPDHIPLLSTAQHLAAQCHVVVSTAPCKESDFTAMGALPWRSAQAIYGSTETGAIGTRNARESHYALVPFMSRTKAGLVRNDQPCPIQDKLIWHDDTHFSIAGRLDNTVQFRGYNLVPDELEQRLRSCAHIDNIQVQCFTEPASKLAFTIHCQHEHKSDIETWIADNLPPYNQPTDINWQWLN